MNWHTDGLSSTKTSSSCLRPRSMALLTSSRRRVSPRPSAFPVLRHSILTWFPLPGRVRASTVGAKNMASSSGWAMSRHILLLRRVGKRAWVVALV